MNLLHLSLAFLSLTHPLIASAESHHGSGARRSRYHGNKHGPRPNPDTDSQMSDTAAQGAGVHSSDATIPKTGPPADITKACSLAKDKNFCVKSLTGNPTSKGMDMKQLLLLAVQMAQDKGMDVSDFIDGKMKEEETLPEGLEEALNDCADEYHDALSQMDDAVDSLFRVLPYNDMRSWLSGAMLSSTVCRSAVVEGTGKSVFDGDDDVVFSKMCDNALSIVTNMQADALHTGAAKSLS